MLTALFVGIVVGLVLSLPPGPISVAVMRHALAGEFRYGLLIGVGAATMDTFYSLAAIFASTALIVAVKETVMSNGWLLLILQIAAVGVMVNLGFKYMKPTQADVQETARKEASSEARAEKIGGRRPYVVGIFMSVVNLPSPTFLPSLIAVATYLHANNWVDSSVTESVSYAIGFGIGAAVWFGTVLRTLHTVRTRISPTFIGRIYTFTGASFFLFAVVLVYNIVRTTSWETLW